LLSIGFKGGAELSKSGINNQTLITLSQPWSSP
jgi:hypothetical protein